MTKVKETRKAIWKAYHKVIELNWRNGRGNERKYLAKMGYMLYFLATCLPCEKKFLDNWKMPDYRWIEKVRKGGIEYEKQKRT